MGSSRFGPARFRNQFSQAGKADRLAFFQFFEDLMNQLVDLVASLRTRQPFLARERMGDLLAFHNIKNRKPARVQMAVVSGSC